MRLCEHVYVDLLLTVLSPKPYTLTISSGGKLRGLGRQLQKPKLLGGWSRTALVFIVQRLSLVTGKRLVN